MVNKKSDKYIVRSIRLPENVWNMMKNISDKSYRPLNSQIIKIFEGIGIKDEMPLSLEDSCTVIKNLRNS